MLLPTPPATSTGDVLLNWRLVLAVEGEAWLAELDEWMAAAADVVLTMGRATGRPRR
jgi:hypothetical protein